MILDLQGAHGEGRQIFKETNENLVFQRERYMRLLIIKHTIYYYHDNHGPNVLKKLANVVQTIRKKTVPSSTSFPVS